MGALIYLVILGMWAAYLVPMALRRHDELSESRSVDRFSTAMRVLSRRTPTTDRRYVVMPARETPSRPTIDGARADDDVRRSESRRPGGRRPTGRPPVTPRRERISGIPTSDAGRARLVVRRRRVLLALVVLALVVSLAVPLSPLPWWTGALTLLAAVGYAAHLRSQARREREFRRRRQSVHERVDGRTRRLSSAERLEATRRMREADRIARERAETRELEDAEREAELLAEQEAARAGGWEPVPMTLPTYVTKPKAGPVSRIIDLTRPGRWASELRPSTWLDDFVATPSSAQDEQDTRRAAAQAALTPYDDRATDAAEDAELDEILTRRRAVND